MLDAESIGAESTRAERRTARWPFSMAERLQASVAVGIELSRQQFQEQADVGHNPGRLNTAAIR